MGWGCYGGSGSCMISKRLCIGAWRAIPVCVTRQVPRTLQPFLDTFLRDFTVEQYLALKSKTQLWLVYIFIPQVAQLVLRTRVE